MSDDDIASVEQHVLAVLSSDRFLRMEGLGNEVPFFIWPYPPEQELEVQSVNSRIVDRLRTTRGLSVLVVDLFELAVELLEGRGGNMLERLEQIEPTRSRSAFRRDLQRMLDPEQHIVPAIERRIEAEAGVDLLVLTGIGRVFPFIRSHNVLNNLQVAVPDFPVLMLFPGEYSQTASLGSSLVLFNLLTDDQYYRAKNILEQEPA
ncbi:DUF1788 domain-containing protein [Actinomyces oris]|uniref:DUF1788 domain-containing protein n=1 Tax=Actinomyces oris TaxID=544580 RepID=UPI00094D576E|nr:DUF1788 domain-containing protein [Actinomyces oris]OLO54917.1 hypothetical protein BKH26_09170 [Actinomyces oris]OLO62855.1 hypothetical protein BKH24_00990 [Actinomyces oris]